MDQESWLKWGVIGVAVIAGFLLIAAALNTSDGLDGSSWSVEELVVDGSLTAPLENSVITAQFQDGSVSGIASCNNYFGSYATDGDKIAFGPLGTTLMACIPELAPQETAYLESLGIADRYSVDGDTLELRSGDTVLVRYSRLTAETR